MNTRPRYLLSTGMLPHNTAAGITGEIANGNIVVEMRSFIATEPVAVKGLQELAAGSLVAIFTSVTAVEAVLTAGIAPREWKIYCLSGATCRRIAGQLGAALIVGQANSAVDLAERIRDVESQREVWFFCGDRRREELPAILTRAGFTVVEKVVYRTVLTPQRVDRDYDGIAFFSPTAVESYFSLNAAGPGTVMFAIGPSTAEAIRSRCDNPVVTPELPDKTMLMRRMIEHFSNKLN